MIPNIAPLIGAMTPAAIDKVQALEDAAMLEPQIELRTTHTLHAGMYARTVYIPAGISVTGVLIRVPTLLIFDGDALVFTGRDEPLELKGFHVLHAAAGRKQAVFARTDTAWTMVFTTDAKTVAEAEEEFTAEADKLATRRLGHQLTLIKDRAS